MIAIGFGIIEQQEREKIKNLLLSSAMRGENLQEVSKKWNKERDLYDAMDRSIAPQRYTKFYIYDGAIHYTHINRNHAFSPDGWAALSIEEPFERKEEEDER